MPTCQNCHRKWSWKQTIKKSFTLDTGMTCPFCREKQYVSSRTRKITTIFSLAAPAFLLINIFLTLSFVFLFLLISFMLLFLGIYPFFVELSNREEPLW